MKKNLFIKILESCSAVLPITAIVLLLHFTISPMPAGLLAMFLFGAVFLILGMGIFTLGADMAMMPMGEKVEMCIRDRSMCAISLRTSPHLEQRNWI